MKLRYTWICPHCGFKNTGLVKVRASSGYTGRQVELCNCDEGGCDQYVVVEPQIKIAVKTYKLVATVQDDDLADYHANAIPGESLVEYKARILYGVPPRDELNRD